MSLRILLKKIEEERRHCKHKFLSLFCNLLLSMNIINDMHDFSRIANSSRILVELVKVELISLGPEKSTQSIFISFLFR